MSAPQERRIISKVAVESGVWCNQPCGFCFANFKTPPEVRRQILNQDATVDVDSPLTTKEFKTLIIDPLSTMGGRQMHFTGGDFFLRKDCLELVEYTKKKGLMASVDTNAVVITQPRNEELFKRIIPLFNEVGIPLEAPEEDLQVEMRDHALSFKAPLKFLTMAQELKSTASHFPRIKVNTVVTGVNYQRVPDMVDLLAPYMETGIIDRWSVDKFLPMERGEENKERFQLSSDPQEAERRYTATVDQVRQRLHEKGLSRFAYNYEDKFVDNFIISPTGIVYVPEGSTKSFVPRSLRNTSLSELLALANMQVSLRSGFTRHPQWERELVSRPRP